MSEHAKPWWRDGVGYEVYLRSFADADGDGIGDLRGLHDRLDYLAWLGVSIVWVTPFYPSPMHDHGYDVADYTDVAPMFGDLAALDAVVDKAHRLGLRLVVDLVPNHSSSQHPWFVEARSGRDNPYRDYYIWRDPAPTGGPPNNWPSHFGGDAWTYDDRTGQYWCHLFLPEQPDLNWQNPAVADEFDAILRFWLQRGVDGFRIDVAHALVKHPDLPDLPPAPEPDEVELGELVEDYATFEGLHHVYDVNQPGVLDVYRRWRRVAEQHDGLLLGEVYLLEAQSLAPYVEADDGLHLSFWFGPLHVDWNPKLLRDALVEAAAIAPHGGIAWVQGSHDRSRAVTRFGGGDRGRARALALATLMMGLPGVPFIYQGEELGLSDGVISHEDAQDPLAARAGAFDRNRDVCRTPMPWTPGPGLGFTSAARAWLPFGDRRDEDTVAVQQADASSMLHRYRALIALRRGGLDQSGPLTWLTDDGPVLAYRRGGVIVAANCEDTPQTLPLPDRRWRVRFDSARTTEGVAAGDDLTLDPGQAVVLQRA